MGDGVKVRNAAGFRRVWNGPLERCWHRVLSLCLWTPLPSRLLTLSLFGPESLYLLSGPQSGLGPPHNPDASSLGSVTFSSNSTFQEGQASHDGVVSAHPAQSAAPHPQVRAEVLLGAALCSMSPFSKSEAFQNCFRALSSTSGL